MYKRSIRYDSFFNIFKFLCVFDDKLIEFRLIRPEKEEEVDIFLASFKKNS